MKSRTLRVGGFGAFLAVAGAATVARAAVPPRTESGTTLVVPDSHTSLGRVYYVRYPAHSGQVTFVSDAPIERIVGTTDKIVGYVVAGIADGAPTGSILAGGFRLPVRSFDSGIDMRNGHMMQPEFLDAEKFPEITFEVTGSRDVVEVERGDGFTTYSLTLTGNMTIRDVTMPMAVPATVTLMPASDTTRNAGPGDVMALRSAYTVNRTRFGVGVDFVNPELTDDIALDQMIILTTEPLETRLAAAENGERFIRIQRLKILIGDLRDLDAAAEYGRAIMQDFWDDATALNELAWDAATTDGTNLRRLDFVEEAALRASELTDGTNADILDTVARVYYEKGDLDAAVDWELRAMEHRQSAGDPEGIVRTLHTYQKEAGVPLTSVAEEVVRDLPQTAEILAAYTGTYILADDGTPIEFLVGDEGRLQIRWGTLDPRALLYHGGNEFRLAGQTHVRFVFRMDGDRAAEMAMHQGLIVVTARR